MTEEECRRWRVPELYTDVDFDEPLAWTWPSHAYAAIRNWQVARGFDPTTADFARSCGYPEFDILIDNEAAASRFEEVHENLSTPDKQSDPVVPEELDTPLAVEATALVPQPLLKTSKMEPSQNTVTPEHSMVHLEKPPCVIKHNSDEFMRIQNFSGIHMNSSERRGLSSECVRIQTNKMQSCLHFLSV
ncbi:hypothetical protein VNI00_015875 [Paramarasmius palmivorus]|uniref:Uncharacterized protein n=1 Tax=Paramarasmius palmivorus TaxID=297713 RepID=A0AAW0BIS7_9AGAR